MASKLQTENECLKDELEQCKNLLHKQEIDELTGFYSRNKFFGETQKMLEQNSEKNFVFIRADVDHFQLVNSFFGLEEGDRLLQYFAYHLKPISIVSPLAVLGRIEADIFVICCQLNVGNLVMTMLRRGITALIDGYRDDYKLSVSVGIYNIEDNSMSVDVIYSKAIFASKKCKKNYGEYYSVYDENMSEDSVRRQHIANEMYPALVEKQFIVFFQPKCSLTDGRIVGAEALVRWHHPERGIISPDDFIPVFESNGFISKLSEYVWNETCAYIRSWIDSGIDPIPISVNVSRIDLNNAKLPNIFKSMLEKYDIPVEYLHLEITESDYSENPLQIVEAVKNLKDMGFHIEMDDFGTGYSSLNILNEMDIDTLKLDMLFIQGQGGIRDNNGHIVNFIVLLAKQLNLLVVAEGVETSEQVSFLRSIGCDIGQGYFFSKPIPKEDFNEYLSSHRREITTHVEVDNQIFLDLEDVWFPNSKFNFIFNNFVGALILYEVKNSEVRVVRVNDGYRKILKCSPEDFTIFKNNILKNIHPDDTEKNGEEVQNLLATGDSYKMEMRTSTFAPSGGYVWIRINSKVVVRAENSVLFLATIEDITEERLSLEKLQKTVVLREDLKKQLSIYQTVGGSSVFSARLGKKLNLLYANDAFYELHEITKEYAIEHADTVLLETLHPDDTKRVMTELKEIVKREDETFELEMKILTGKGNVRSTFAKGHICYDKKEAILDIVVNDITYLRNQISPNN